MTELFSFIYGSQVYGTATPDSDTDMFIVCDDDIDEIEKFEGNIDKHYISLQHFIELIRSCDVKALEAIWLDDKYIDGNIVLFRKTINDNFELDLKKIRQSISSVCSNSWVKCKKKLTVEKDYDPYTAKKSLWHVLRLYMLGIQIGKYHKIINYSEANYYYDNIMSMPDDWQKIKNKYQQIRNELHSSFVALCPLN